MLAFEPLAHQLAQNACLAAEFLQFLPHPQVRDHLSANSKAPKRSIETLFEIHFRTEDTSRTAVSAFLRAMQGLDRALQAGFELVEFF